MKLTDYCYAALGLVTASSLPEKARALTRRADDLVDAAQDRLDSVIDFVRRSDRLARPNP